MDSANKTHIPGCDCDECLGGSLADSKTHVNACTCDECVTALLKATGETLKKTELAFEFIHSIYAIEQAFKGDFYEANKSIQSVSARYLEKLRIAGMNITNLVDAELVARAQEAGAAA